MSVSLSELRGLRVTLDRLEYNPYFEGTPSRPHAFTYYITIHNESEECVTIKGRKWVITSKTGEIMVYEGDGVVGEHPRIEPGQQFHYNSYHLIDAKSTAEGSYIGHDSRGGAILVRIPSFVMDVPLTNAGLVV